MTRRDDSLIGQIVAANVVLFALTLLAASVAAGLDLGASNERWEFLILALAIMLTLCMNLWMLQRRFRPLERLIDEIEAIDPSAPAPLELRRGATRSRRSSRLASSFHGLLQRIEEERRRSGPARDARAGGGAPPARARPPRRGQPGADRDPAAARGARPGDAARARAGGRRAEAAREPGDGRAAQPGPPAAAVGARRPRAGARGRDPAQALLGAHRHRGAPRHPRRPGPAAARTSRRRSTASPRRRSPTSTRHAGATVVEVDLEASRRARAELRVRDDGGGFDPPWSPGRRPRGPPAGSAWSAWPSAPGSSAASSTCAPPPAAAPRSR